MADMVEDMILSYLREHSTMVLATYGPEGPWATPVFYVNKGFRLYFLSEPTTRHSINLQGEQSVAAAITENYWEWQTIRGLQLQGKAFLVRGTMEMAAALASYCMKFPAVRQVLESPGSFKGVTAARWHCLVPEILKYTDNGKGFGQRFELRLEN